MQSHWISDDFSLHFVCLWNLISIKDEKVYSVDSCVPTVNAFNFTKLTNKITKKKKIPNSPKFEMHYIDCIKWSRCFRFQTFSCPLHLFYNKFSFLSNKLALLIYLVPIWFHSFAVCKDQNFECFPTKKFCLFPVW